MDLEKEVDLPEAPEEGGAEPSLEPKIEPPTIPPPKPESRMRRAVRRTFRRVLGLLIIFGLGVIVALAAFYLPQARQLKSVQGELDQSNQQVEALNAEIGSQKIEMNAQIDSLKAELDSRDQMLAAKETQIEELKQAEQNVQVQVTLLSALVDVTSANLALAQEDASQANVYLSNTPETIQMLGDLLGEDYQEEIDKILERLNLALGEIDSDPAEAQAFLGIVENRLTDLENVLFAGP